MTSNREDMAQIASDGMALALTGALLAALFAHQTRFVAQLLALPANTGQSGIEISLQQAAAEIAARAAAARAAQGADAPRDAAQATAAKCPIAARASASCPSSTIPCPKEARWSHRRTHAVGCRAEFRCTTGFGGAIRRGIARRHRPQDAPAGLRSVSAASPVGRGASGLRRHAKRRTEGRAGAAILGILDSRCSGRWPSSHPGTTRRCRQRSLPAKRNTRSR